MTKTIVYQEQVIKYEINHNSRAKYYRLSIRPGGVVRLVVPRGGRVRQAEDFLRRKLDWVADKISQQTAKTEAIDPIAAWKEFVHRRRQARELVLERLAFFNQTYQLKYQRVSIRNQKTRWGSCSSRGNLNFHFRILDLPPELADYLVVHELCHLRELNHSPRFWALVARTIPDYRAAARKLRRIKPQTIK